MKTMKSNHFISIEELDVEDLEVEVEYHWENDGIGSYEYWGFRGYDAGHNYIEMDGIEPIFTDQSEELKAAINKYIDENFEKLDSELSVQIAELIKY